MAGKRRKLEAREARLDARQQRVQAELASLHYSLTDAPIVARNLRLQHHIADALTPLLDKAQEAGLNAGEWSAVIKCLGANTTAMESLLGHLPPKEAAKEERIVPASVQAWLNSTYGPLPLCGRCKAVSDKQPADSAVDGDSGHESPRLPQHEERGQPRPDDPGVHTCPRNLYPARLCKLCDDADKYLGHRNNGGRHGANGGGNADR